MVRAKSVKFAVSLGNNNFKASTSWLDGCKDCTDFYFRAVCGESGAVDMDAAND